MEKDGQKFLILENIRSAQNVGAMFRTADAIGVDMLFLVGYTAAPIDRFGRPQKEVAKSALGAEQNVPWEQHQSAPELIQTLQKRGVTVFALEQHHDAQDYKTVAIEGDVALVVGNEVDGVSDEALAAADSIIEIPMRGDKESLNVSVATGITLFRLFDT